MQIYADVLRRPLHLIGSEQGPALGSAIHAAVAAGEYDDIHAASAAMGSQERDAYAPDEERADAYDELYADYMRLHDHFGRGGDDVMHRAAPPRGAGSSSVIDTLSELRRTVCDLHAELPRHGLVAWTSGNLSARVPGEELMVIKASGIPFEDLTPEHMVLCDFDGRRRRGRPRRPPATPPPTATSTATCRRPAASPTPTAPTPPRGPRAARASPAC